MADTPVFANPGNVQPQDSDNTPLMTDSAVAQSEPLGLADKTPALSDGGTPKTDALNYSENMAERGAPRDLEQWGNQHGELNKLMDDKAAWDEEELDQRGLAQSKIRKINNPTAATHNIVAAPDGSTVAFPKNTPALVMQDQMSKWWTNRVQNATAAWDSVRHAATNAAQAIGLPSDQPEWQLATDEFMRDPVGKSADVVGALIGGLAHGANSVIPNTPENKALAARAQAAWERGDHLAAATTLTPLIGDGLAKAVKQAQDKDFSGSIGTTLGVAAPFLTDTFKAEPELPVSREQAYAGADRRAAAAPEAPAYAGAERRGALMSPTQIETNLKTGQPVTTPFDSTEGAMDTINRDLASRLETKPRIPTPEEDTAFFNKKEAEAQRFTGNGSARQAAVRNLDKYQYDPTSGFTGKEGVPKAATPEELRTLRLGGELPKTRVTIDELSDRPEKKIVSIKVDGERAGQISLTPMPELGDGAMEVSTSQLQKKFQGQGHGTEAYRQVIDYAREKGANALYSDDQVSPQADRVWQSLKDRGIATADPTTGRYKIDLSPERAGTDEGAAKDSDLFAQAKAKLGADASFSEVAQEAQRMKTTGEADPMVVRHWSKQGIPLTETDPAKFGTGRAGEETKRANEPGFLPRTYFGMEGYREPEVQSGLEHKATLDRSKFYNVNADPQGIWQKGYAEGGATAAEKAVKDAGYSGYYSPEQQVAASFDKVPVKAARVSELQDAADAYNKQEGRPPINDRKLPKEPRQDQMAEFYKAAKHDPTNPEVVASYDALKKDIDKQYDLGKKLGYNFEGTGTGDTYSDSYTGLKKDVFHNKNVKVWQGADFPEDHPLSEIDPKTGMRYADKLLAIHDLFGHAAHDNNFSVNGEENAWNVHRQMFSKEAQPALATETRMRGAYGAKYKEFPSKAMATPEHFQVRNEEVNGKATEPLRNAVNDFNKQAGRPPMDETKVEIDPRQQEIAEAYARSKHTPDTPKVKAAYDAFKRDIDKQFNMAKKLGYTFDAKESDPYEGSGIGNEANAYDLLRKDAIENKHISAWKGGKPPLDHPLSEVDKSTGLTYNEKLRVIHDLFGHVLPDNDFTAKGEENAWNAHRQMFSKEAEPVLATETRGQTAYQAVNNKFADQRATILPKEFRSTADEAAREARNIGNEKSLEGRVSFKDVPVEQYNTALGKNFVGSPWTEESELAKSKRYQAVVDGKPVDAYFGLTPDGELIGAVNNSPIKGLQKFSIEQRVQDALAAGQVPHLTAWDVKGELPKRYDRFGFKTTKFEPYDEATYGPPPESWKDSWRAMGWKDGDPYPGVRHMSYKGLEPNVKASDLWTDESGTYTSGAFMRYLAKNKLMSKAGKDTLETASKEKVVPGWAEVSKFLTPEDRAQASASVQRNVVDLVNKFNPDWVEDAAKAGSAAKGWYQRATALIQHMFGDEAHRFTNFVASLSPQKDVEQNLTDAINFYNLWQEAGKPLGPENEKVIRDLTERAEVGMSGQVARNQLYENLVNEVQPTGPKVSNFARNLKGNMDAVTKDRWMAYLFGNNERMFRWFKEGSPKPAVHMAADALVRAVGQNIGMLPAEVQETAWSFLRTVVNLTEKQGISTKVAVGSVTDALIREGASELTRLIADSPKVQSALNRLATATGDERFRAVNLQNSPKFKQLLEEHKTQAPTAGGIGATNRAGLERGVNKAIEARSEISQAKKAKEAAPEWDTDLSADREFPGKEPGSRLSKTQKVPLSQIEPSEKSNPKQVAKLVEQLKKDPSKVPPLVVEFSHDGPRGEDIVSVADGHNRLQAAKQLGIKEAPVKVHVAPDDWKKVQSGGGMEIKRPQTVKAAASAETPMFERRDGGFNVRMGKKGNLAIDYSGKDSATVKAVDVDEDSQRQGIATRMYQEAKKELLNRGITTLKGSLEGSGPLQIREKVFGPGNTKYFHGGDEVSAKEAQKIMDKDFGYVRAETNLKPDKAPKKAPKDKATEFNPDDLSNNFTPSLSAKMKDALS